MKIGCQGPPYFRHPFGYFIKRIERLNEIAAGRPDAKWRPYVVSENQWGRMVRSKRFKYCVYESGAPRESLVDLEQDPGEMKNLAAAPGHRKTLQRHRRYLQEWIETSNDAAAKAFAIGV